MQKKNSLGNHSIQIKILFILLLMPLALFKTCHYHLKPVLPGHIKTVAVGDFSNLTVAYELDQILSEQLINEIELDGTLKIESINKADSLFSGEITNYKKDPVAFYQDKTVKEYAVYIEVKIDFFDNITQKYIQEDMGISRAKTYFVLREFSKEEIKEKEGIYYSESEAVSAILKDIAEEIMSRILESW